MKKDRRGRQQREALGAGFAHSDEDRAGRIFPKSGVFIACGRQRAPASLLRPRRRVIAYV